jgi:ribosome maturation factor RimP
MPTLTVAFIAPLVESLGYEFVDLEFTEKGFVRIYIDKPGHKPSQREGGITVDDCSKVSHHLTHLFAVESIDYQRLEISSPGLDRPVKTKADFARFAGEAVKVRLHALVDGRRNLDGQIIGVDGDDLVIAAEGKQYKFDLELVDRARLNPDVSFGQAAQPKTPSAPKPKRPSNAKRRAN